MKHNKENKHSCVCPENWYISVDDIVITVNAHSYTIITAHREKR
jgi:hypothetical protein